MLNVAIAKIRSFFFVMLKEVPAEGECSWLCFGNRDYLAVNFLLQLFGVQWLVK